ncbi:glycosyltransferase family 2 protein [Candidatus Binatia bacterium]|nr:glycosyltransferase family 2 protein [Candidatus Binatia bacterium]
MSATVGIVVLNWNGDRETTACIASLRAQHYRESFIVLVDNDSNPDVRARLDRAFGDAHDVECCWLDTNRGYAGGMNAGLAVACRRGADLLVVITQDVVFAPGALAALVAGAADTGAGIVGPRVLDARRAGHVLSIGERVSVPLLCVPRTLLRYRVPRSRPYAVGGVMGCAMLLTRRCVDAVGGFDPEFFAYYEEVDLCLRARRHGFGIACAPEAVVTHDGMRGFAAGFTAVSAELKARNLIRLIRRWARPADYLILLPTYALLLGGSAALYAARRRTDVLSALWHGMIAGLQGKSGPPNH